MSKIINIPIELLDCILKLVAEPITQLHVCRRFNEIATPIAYRHVQLRDLRNLQLLLRTVIARPALGAYTQSLDIEFSYEYEEIESASFSPANEDDLPNFVEEAVLHNLPQKVQLGLEKGSVEAMSLLLLCYLPALQALDIHPTNCRGDIFFHHILLLPSGLQSLRSVSISDWDTEGLVGKECITPFFCLPALRSFACWCVDIGDIDSDKDLPAGSSYIEEIALEHSVVDGESVATMVRSTRALRSFIFSHGSASVWETFSAPPLWHALRENAKNTLQHLQLDFDIEDNKFPGPIGSLCDFVQLTDVFAPLAILLGEPHENNIIPLRLSTILPRSLASLGLWIDEVWESRACQVVVELLNNKRDNVALLKELCIDSCIEDSELETIRSACVAEGVEFFKIHWNEGWSTMSTRKVRMLCIRRAA